MARAIDARHLALDVLDRVLGDRRPLDDSFAGHPQLGALDGRDRAFARLLVTTVLRRLGQIDALLAAFVRTPPKAIRVQNILRIGAAQLVFLGTPAHAAVAATVALASGGHRFAAGLANAVLRRVAEAGRAGLAEQDAARLNVPDWLWQSWCATYGEPRTRAIIRAQLREPPLDLTVKEAPELWAERLDGTWLYGKSVRRPLGGRVERLPGYAEGAWWVQDAAAALPGALLGGVRGREVIDLCAAPGGKTAQLAAAGARVTAVEISARRAERLRANLERLRLAAEVVVADALEWRPPHRVEYVLLDAPCSATGTIRRHPDITWQKRPVDVERMAELQRRLLLAAAGMLAPDGVLVYASCSLQPEEGPQVIERVLAERAPVVRSPIGPDELGGLAVEISIAGEVRTLPCHLAAEGGLDGFFIARLRRPG